MSTMDEFERSFDYHCDATLVSLERAADLLTDQVKRDRGLVHLWGNWKRFNETLKKLKDIEADYHTKAIDWPADNDDEDIRFQTETGK